MRNSEQTNDTALNRQQFMALAGGLKGFQYLISVLGQERAESVATLLFERETRETDRAGRYLLIPMGAKAELRTTVDNWLRAECAQAIEKQIYVTELLEAANAGRLRKSLTERTEDEASYTRLRGAPRGATPGREVVWAADWVGRSMHGEGRRLATDILTREVLTAPSGVALGRTPQLFDRVHAEIAPDAPRVSSPNADTAYPSSIGGRFLLELIFELTAGTRWPRPGDIAWIDAALFYLGAVTTVQGYPDGNKRIGRLAYAITLLKGGRPFVAPDFGLEADLIRLGAADHSRRGRGPI